MLEKDLFLSDIQYYNLLLKIKKIVYDDSFVVFFDNHGLYGNKYTESNCGFCNRDLAGEKYKLNDRFLKYQQKNHKCPMDSREYIDKESLGFGFGCFEYCILRNRNINIQYIRQVVSTLITKVEKWKNIKIYNNNKEKIEDIKNRMLCLQDEIYKSINEIHNIQDYINDRSDRIYKYIEYLNNLNEEGNEYGEI